LFAGDAGDEYFYRCDLCAEWIGWLECGGALSLRELLAGLIMFGTAFWKE
jgi:hypothetical protein